MHHERNTSDEIASAMAAQAFWNAQERADGQEAQRRAEAMELGPTGRFPGGKLTENDEGQIAFAVGILKGKVVINFGVPIASLGMSPEEAIRLGKTLIQKAKSTRGRPVGRKRRRRRQRQERK